MPPNLMRGLVVFCAVARYLSFKMAANELCITPSAVSHQIKALEDRVGCPLFERRTRMIVLTATGALLFSEVDPLLRNLDAVTSPFLGSRRERRQPLRVALFPFFASEIFIPALGEFAKSHADIDLRIDTIETSNPRIPPGCDASIVLLPSAPEDLHATPLFRLELVPACAPEKIPEKALTEPGALNDSVLIVHNSRPDAWSEWFRSVGVKFEAQPQVICLDSMFSVARAAEQGLGIALVPVPLIDAWFENNALVQLSNEKLDSGERYYFLQNLETANDPEIAALRRWASETFRGHERN